MPEEPPRLQGEYRGLVRDRNDPEKSGRVKVFVEPIHRGVSTENLPWAIPHESVKTGGTQDGDDYGSVDIPNENTWVVIEFENGRPEQPIYKYESVNKGQVPDRFQGKQDDVYSDIDSNTAGDEPGAEVSDYPNARGFKLKNGIVVEYDDSDENPRTLIYHPSGFRFEVLPDGNAVFHSENNKYHVIKNDLIELIQGNEESEVKGDKSETVGGNSTSDIGGNYDATIGGDQSKEVSGALNNIADSGIQLQGSGLNLSDILVSILTNIQNHTHPTSVGPTDVPINNPSFATDQTNVQTWTSV